MSTVRVRADIGAAVLFDGVATALVPGAAYDSSEPIVRQFPWAFESDVESASSRPGEKRNVRRPRGVASLAPEMAGE